MSQLDQLRLAPNAKLPLLVFYVEMNWLRRSRHVTLLLLLLLNGERGVDQGEVGIN